MKLLLYWRMARLLLHVVYGMALCALVFPWAGRARRYRHISGWSRGLLKLCRVSLAPPVGQAALAQTMLVANHVSWLDIFVIDALYPCRFVAKEEIRNWPMLGWLAAGSGTIFIARGNRRDLRHVFKGLVDKLACGERVGVFPEGTTGAQGELLPFHANLFEAAIDAGVPVQPLALAYTAADGTLAAQVDFLGDTTFAASLQAILRGPPITATLTCLAPLSSKAAHRRELAAATRAAIAAALGQPT